jgi:flagellar biosynthesis chaperone FliJ
VEETMKELQRLLQLAERKTDKAAGSIAKADEYNKDAAIALKQFHDAAVQLIETDGAKAGVTMAVFVPKNPK